MIRPGKKRPHVPTVTETLVDLPGYPTYLSLSIRLAAVVRSVAGACENKYLYS